MKTNKKEKKRNVLIIILLLLAGIFLFFRRNEKKPDILSCVPKPKLTTGGEETRPYAALYWNNPGGLVQTSTIWTSFGEVKNQNNKTRYKAFNSYDNGIKANLYNLLTYFSSRKLRKVKDIVSVWVGTSPGQTPYVYYIRTIGFSEDCNINSLEQLKVLFTNMMYAENTNNNTQYIYDNFHKFYNEIVRQHPLVKFS